MSKGAGAGRRRWVAAGNAPGDAGAPGTVVTARWLDPEVSAGDRVTVDGALGALSS